MPLAETVRRNCDPDANGKAPFGDRDHLACVARHSVLFLFSEPCHGPFTLSSRLGDPNQPKQKGELS